MAEYTLTIEVDDIQAPNAVVAAAEFKRRILNGQSLIDIVNTDSSVNDDCSMTWTDVGTVSGNMQIDASSMGKGVCTKCGLSIPAGDEKCACGGFRR